jgi:hypothetical protein
MLPPTVTDTDLATGEGRKRVCPDLAITELSKRNARVFPIPIHGNGVYAIYGFAAL